MPRKFLALVLLSLFLCTSCTNPTKELQRYIDSGEYQNAITSADERFQKTHNSIYLFYRAQGLYGLGLHEEALKTMKLYRSVTPPKDIEVQSIRFALTVADAVNDYREVIATAEELIARKSLSVNEAVLYYRALMKMNQRPRAEEVLHTYINNSLDTYDKAKLFLSSANSAEGSEAIFNSLRIDKHIRLGEEIIPSGLERSIAEAWFVYLRNHRVESASMYRILALLAGQAGRRFDEAEYAILYQTYKDSHE